MRYALVLTLLAAAPAAAQESAAERGRIALTTRTFTPATWPASAYDGLWQHWQRVPQEKPRDYDRAVREHYGLHAAPFENGRLPMGLRETRGLLGKGITTDCMLCHGGSIFGKSTIGLGNSTLDIHALFDDLNKASGRSGKLPFTFSNVRGTTEAAGFSVFLFSFREPDLKVRLSRHGFNVRDDLCEDTPAWWLLKKKKTMYHTGTIDAHSVRSLMQFMLSPLNGRSVFDRTEPTFVDVRAFLVSLTPPRYPLPIDEPRAAEGEKLFRENCARCHGTYGREWTYPNKVIPLDVIGTDRNRFDGLPAAYGELYNRSWFAQESGTFKASEPKGYQAPPLDGIWATAPYFHNGSVPTLMDVLNSKARPKIFTRSFATGADDYDPLKVGWKVKVLDSAPDATVSAFERRKVYDTTQPGRGNAGHTFGDDLTSAERRAVVEYLKKL